MSDPEFANASVAGWSVSRWQSGIRDYFNFINRRRVDARFAVLPNKGRLVLAFATIVIFIILLILVIDPIYLSWVQSPSFAKTAFWSWLTTVGSSTWILTLTGIMLITLSFITADRFSGPKNLLWHKVFLSSWYVFSSVALSGIFILIMKHVFARGRPETVEGSGVWISQYFTDIYLFGSFPSGHSTTAGAIAIALAVLFPKLRAILVSLGIWVAVSRSVLGVHFPSDVFAGFTIGSVFSYFWARYFAQKRLLFRFSKTGGLQLRGEGQA